MGVPFGADECVEAGNGGSGCLLLRLVCVLMLSFYSEHFFRVGAERLNVYHDVIHFRDTVPNALFHLVGQGVGLPEGHVSVRFHVQSYHVFSADAP